jgi:hypothetical protein
MPKCSASVCSIYTVVSSRVVEPDPPGSRTNGRSRIYNYELIFGSKSGSVAYMEEFFKYSTERSVLKRKK